MGILSIIVDNYFRIMESINVRSISIVIIVVIILIELLELFIKPEDLEATILKTPKKNKTAKSNFLRRIVKIKDDKKPTSKKEKTNPFNKDNEGNYFVSTIKNNIKEAPIMIPGGKEVLGSKIIEINTVLDGNNLYLERITKKGEE